MEALGLGWLAELAKAGTGWLVSCLLSTVVWWLYRELQRCQAQSREDAKAMTEALTRATDVNRDLITVQRERVQAERETGSAMQILVKQIETSDTLARERAEDIRRTIREGRSNERA